MVLLPHDESGYPRLNSEDMRWIVALLESKVEDPNDIEFVGRERDGLDLEIVFGVAPRSRYIFTAEVCLEITRQVAQRTGVLEPVIYVHGDPHPSARESLNYAANRL